MYIFESFLFSYAQKYEYEKHERDIVFFYDCKLKTDFGEIFRKGDRVNLIEINYSDKLIIIQEDDYGPPVVFKFSIKSGNVVEIRYGRKNIVITETIIHT